MVRVGVQSVNSDTLAAVDRKGDREKVLLTLQHLKEFDVPYSVDHIIGLPGEGAADQLDALRFYTDVQPKRIVTHWMTYFPGTTALEQARQRGILDDAAVGEEIPLTQGTHRFLPNLLFFQALQASRC